MKTLLRVKSSRDRVGNTALLTININGYQILLLQAVDFLEIPMNMDFLKNQEGSESDIWNGFAGSGWPIPGLGRHLGSALAFYQTYLSYVGHL